MRRRLSDQEKADAAELALLWERSKHKSAKVKVTVMDETDDQGRAIYDVEIHARGTLPATGAQQSLEI